MGISAKGSGELLLIAIVTAGPGFSSFKSDGIGWALDAAVLGAIFRSCKVASPR
jgi:hypothetical protein